MTPDRYEDIHARAARRQRGTDLPEQTSETTEER